MVRIILGMNFIQRSYGAAARRSICNSLLHHVQELGGNQHSASGATATAYNKVLHRVLETDDDIRNDIAYCLSFSNDESDFEQNFMKLDDLMKGQLAHCYQEAKRLPKSPETHHLDTERLPKTWEEVNAITNSRAIVVTETTRPFRIVHVNRAWEKLCGYSFAEAYGNSLQILHGEETNLSAITSMLSPLLHENKESGTVLTNYTKDKQKFRNRIRVGCIYDDISSRSPSHFVGVLQEINDGM